jgi:outer membrane immunogenic protein
LAASKLFGSVQVQEASMKRMLFAGALALAAATPAMAADLPEPAPPPQAPAAYTAPGPVYNWSGVYIGINGGYAFGNSSWGATTGFAGTGNFDVNDGLVGGTLGVNFQTGQFVFGVEADGDWTDISGSTSSSTLGGCVANCTYQTSNDWLGTIRGRIGYAFDRVLLYGTAGGAGGNVKSSFTDSAGFSASGSSTEFGWTAGAGIEYAITDNITAKAEYLFVDLSNGTFSCPAGTCGGAGAPAMSVPVSFDASLIRAGLNFKFNPW